MAGDIQPPPSGYGWKSPNLTGTIVASIVGALAAIGPVLVSASARDVSKPFQGPLLNETMQIFFMDFSVFNMFQMIREFLLASTALGITASINWFESHRGRIDSLGLQANLYAGLAFIGTFACMFYLIFAAGLDDYHKLNPDRLTFYLRIGYYTGLGVIVSYFLTLIQVRRAVDAQARPTIAKQLEKKDA